MAKVRLGKLQKQILVICYGMSRGGSYRGKGKNGEVQADHLARWVAVETGRYDHLVGIPSSFCISFSKSLVRLAKRGFIEITMFGASSWESRSEKCIKRSATVHLTKSGLDIAKKINDGHSHAKVKI